MKNFLAILCLLLSACAQAHPPTVAIRAATIVNVTDGSLRAATLNPARVLGSADSLGTIEVGKLADLVLLDANPLADIGNTRRIRAVVADGRVYRRADLERLLAEVEGLNQQVEKQE
jgi:imidazolonepropionase-like amidohydrolase